jgi:hypothetical protein
VEEAASPVSVQPLELFCTSANQKNVINFWYKGILLSSDLVLVCPLFDELFVFRSYTNGYQIYRNIRINQKVMNLEMTLQVGKSQSCGIHHVQDFLWCCICRRAENTIKVSVNLDIDLENSMMFMLQPYSQILY